MRSSSINSQILDEASAWFVDFRVGDADAAAREAFDGWVRRSPEHIHAYLEIAKTYIELPANYADRIDIEKLVACARSNANVVHFELPQHVSAQNSSSAVCQAVIPPQGSSKVSAVADARLPHTRRAIGVAAASLVVAGVLLSAFLLWNFRKYPTYSTDIGETRSVTLTDGSTVDLNARSKIRIRFSSFERTVELTEGQALFRVTKDSARPFVVRAKACLCVPLVLNLMCIGRMAGRR